MMETLLFNKNYNNKLNNEYYTTFRLPAKKFFIGAKLQVILNGHAEFSHIVEVVEIRQMTLSQINNFLAYIDAGVNAQGLVEIMKTIYEHIVYDFSTQIFYFILLKRI